MYEKQEMIEDMYDTIEWIHSQVYKKGANAFAYYDAIVRSQNNCKEYITKPEEEYGTLMIEKYNCAYEDTIRLFNKLDADKKGSELELKLRE